MLQHEFVPQPWSKVPVDLCDFKGQVLLVVSDYYSNYIEVARLSSITSQAINKELKAIFARFGIPDTLISDNGPQFSAVEFSVFTKTWTFDHQTSWPMYVQIQRQGQESSKDCEVTIQKVQGIWGVRLLESGPAQHSA